MRPPNVALAEKPPTRLRIMPLNQRNIAHGVSGDRLRRLTHYNTGALVSVTVFLSSHHCDANTRLSLLWTSPCTKLP